MRNEHDINEGLVQVVCVGHRKWKRERGYH